MEERKISEQKRKWYLSNKEKILAKQKAARIFKKRGMYQTKKTKTMANWNALSRERKQFFIAKSNRWFEKHPDDRRSRHLPQSLAYHDINEKRRRSRPGFRRDRKKRWLANVKADPMRYAAYMAARQAWKKAKKQLLKICPHCNGEVSLGAWKLRKQQLEQGKEWITYEQLQRENEKLLKTVWRLRRGRTTYKRSKAGHSSKRSSAKAGRTTGSAKRANKRAAH